MESRNPHDIGRRILQLNGITLDEVKRVAILMTLEGEYYGSGDTCHVN